MSAPCRLICLALAICSSGCGGGDAPSANGAAGIRALAYVSTECRAAASVFSGRQELHIVRDDGARLQVGAPLSFGSWPAAGLCQIYGTSRFARASVVVGAYQRLGVSPDAMEVVFELTDDFSLVARNGLLSPEEEGIFRVGADGSGLRRLGPASREQNGRFGLDPSQPYGVSVGGISNFTFSPSGRLMAFTDRAPGPAGEDATQIVTMDVRTGARTQVTRLPALAPLFSVYPAVLRPSFIDEETIIFLTAGTTEGRVIPYTVKTDGSDLRAVPPPVVLPGSQVQPTFTITGLAAGAGALAMPGEPMNAYQGYVSIFEIFLFEGENVLQLTNFRRGGTGEGDPVRSSDGQRVFFTASADPFGSNPSESCQIFSISRTGDDLQQLTAFHRDGRSEQGCNGGPPPECNSQLVSQDRETDAVVFYSSCDPLGLNPNGGQMFAVRPDGTGMRQLTDARGMVTEADGAVSVELPGPYAYPGQVR